MILKWILRLNRWWYTYRDAMEDHVKMRREWLYSKDGDRR